jgi:signal transduction histidine kinase
MINLRVTPLVAAQTGFIFLMNDVSELKKAADEMRGQAVKLEASNKAYQDSQIAMLNLLEDARALEGELKREKSGVERKVAERTSELQTERKSLEAIIDGVDFGIYMLGPDLHVTMVNKAMQQLYSRGLEKPYSLAAFDADVKTYVDAQEDIREAMRTHHPVGRSEYPRGNRILRSYRAPLYESTSKSVKFLGMVNVLQDITEMKAVERSRDEFFSIASHELRTPLTAIRGNTAMIQEYFAKQIKDPELKEMIGDIHSSSIRLITLVNDFLNTSRLEQGKIEFKIEPFDLVDLVTEVIKEFKAGDVTSTVPIEAELGGVTLALADRDRLKEVIINLIGNAVKFTEKGSVKVRVSTEAGRIKLSVEDTGHGIPAESQSLLFRKFQQASNNILTRDSTRSSGLGLYIAKMIVTGMGGDIFLEKSAVGKGSTFTVVLPLAKAVSTKVARKKVVT